MDLFNKNQFAAVLAGLTAVLSIAALYFLYSNYSLFVSESENYAADTAKLAQLQSTRPGPNQENLQASKVELDQARGILERLSATIAAESASFDATLSPQDFQDALTEQVNTLTAEAEKVGVILPDDFALGFERYRTELPSPAAAPFLGQQLKSVGNVLLLLTKAGVKRVTSVARAPLPQELQEAAGGPTSGPGEDRLADVTLAPFDIAFEADQANFRGALNSLVSAKPVVFMRLIDIANSQPKAPQKENSEFPAASHGGGATESSQVPVLFGQESLVVTMRLAAVSADGQDRQN